MTALPQWLKRYRTCLQCRRHRFDPVSGRLPGEGNGNPLQYSCLENPMGRGAWQATVHGVTKSQTWLSMHAQVQLMTDIFLCDTSRGLDTLYNVVCTNLLWSEVKSLSRVRLCDPMDYSLPRSSIHGIFQARVLEWIAIYFSRGPSQPRDWTRVSWIVGRRFTVW